VALLAAPAQWERLGEEPAMVPAAVEELLRYDSPVQMTSRLATEDLELDHATIARGASIIVAIGGANRDPSVFDQPDHLNIDRPDANRHLSFSLGVHHCLGAALARLEGRIVLEELTRRYPTLERWPPPQPDGPSWCFAASRPSPCGPFHPGDDIHRDIRSSPDSPRSETLRTRYGLNRGN
jgi:cytochrome P450